LRLAHPFFSTSQNEPASGVASKEFERVLAALGGGLRPGNVILGYPRPATLKK
jgi:hypothetical protein